MYNSVAGISVGVQNAGSPLGGTFPDQGHSYIAIQWQNGGTTILETGPSSTGQLQEANYGVNVGAQQTAGADNNWVGAGTVNLAFGSQDSMNQFAQNTLDAYGNYNANAATNPQYLTDGIDVCNTTTYDALIASGQSLGATNGVMSSLSSQSGLNITGATYNLDVISSMMNNANNPQETFATDPQNPQVDGGGTFTPTDTGLTDTSSGSGNMSGADAFSASSAISGGWDGSFGADGAADSGGGGEGNLYM